MPVKRPRLSEDTIISIRHAIAMMERGLCRYEDGSALRYASEDEHLEMLVALLDAAGLYIKATKKTK